MPHQSGHDGFLIPLRDGETARVRPIQPEDKTAMQAAFTLLSDDSKYTRFLTPLHELNPRLLEYFTEVDQVNHVAWGIEVPNKPELPGIGIARYVRLKDEPNVAEFALTVIDEFQGKGIGTFLLALLYRLAQHQGDIMKLRGVIIPSHDKMIGWMRLLGADIYRTHEQLTHADISIVQGLPSMPDNRAARRFCRILELIQEGEAAYEASIAAATNLQPSDSGPAENPADSE